MGGLGASGTFHDLAGAFSSIPVPIVCNAPASALLAEVAEFELDELSRGGRYEHLARMTRGAYASRAMDVPADVALVSEKRCPRVQAHTYLNRAGGKRLSHLSRCGECARRRMRPACERGRYLTRDHAHRLG